MNYILETFSAVSPWAFLGIILGVLVNSFLAMLLRRKKDAPSDPTLTSEYVESTQRRMELLNRISKVQEYITNVDIQAERDRPARASSSKHTASTHA